MIVLLAVLAVVSSPLDHFLKGQNECERRDGNDLSDYEGCVAKAGEREQREFNRLIALAIRDHRISNRKLSAWKRARDRQCHREWQEIQNINTNAIGQAVCIARFDEKMLRSLKVKHH